MRLWQFPFSTNVERVALALAHKGLDAEPELVAWAAELRGSLERFDALLAGRDHLMGSDFGISDLAVFPFLRYGVRLHDEDVETFHRILAEHLWLEPRHARLRLWIERVDTRPRAGLAPFVGADSATAGS